MTPSGSGYHQTSFTWEARKIGKSQKRKGGACIWVSHAWETTILYPVSDASRSFSAFTCASLKHFESCVFPCRTMELKPWGLHTLCSPLLTLFPGSNNPTRRGKLGQQNQQVTKNWRQLSCAECCEAKNKRFDFCTADVEKQVHYAGV